MDVSLWEKWERKIWHFIQKLRKYSDISWWLYAQHVVCVRVADFAAEHV